MSTRLLERLADWLDMPTQHNSPIYKGSFPQVDAASVMILRHAGALIFGIRLPPTPTIAI